MSIVFYHKSEMQQSWVKEENVVYPFAFIERLDRELDSGNYEYYNNDDKCRKPLRMVFISDDEGRRYFLANESVAVIRKKNLLCKHSVELIEPTKLLEGVLIDGFAVTQPENIDERKTLLDVIIRLLAVTPINNPRFVLKDYTTGMDDSQMTEILKLLKNTIAPQFQWSAQTLLWECLCDIGDVIDCIPKLTFHNGKFNAVTFVIVNKQTSVVESIVDKYTINSGESYNEQQYNSRMVASVANIIEE